MILLPVVSLDLRVRVLLSVQRALVGEITPEMQAVAVCLSPTEVRVVLFVDERTPAEIGDDFDAGAITQIVADFPCPERGDPQIAFERVEVASAEPIPLPAGSVLVFARANVRFRQPANPD